MYLCNLLDKNLWPRYCIDSFAQFDISYVFISVNITFSFKNAFFAKLKQFSYQNVFLKNS